MSVEFIDGVQRMIHGLEGLRGRGSYGSPSRDMSDSDDERPSLHELRNIQPNSQSTSSVLDLHESRENSVAIDFRKDDEGTFTAGVRLALCTSYFHADVYVCSSVL